MQSLQAAGLVQNLAYSVRYHIQDLAYFVRYQSGYPNENLTGF